MITKYNLSRIRLMEFAQVMANVKSFLEKENLEALGLAQMKQTFDEKFIALEESLKPLRKSEYTQKIKALDDQRDTLLTGFIGHCKVFINFPEKEKAEAAQKLVLVNQKYGKAPQRQSHREETAIIRNLLNDLEVAELKKAVEDIGAEKWIEHLAKINETFAIVHSDRTQEQGAIEVGKTKITRSEMQEVFSKLVTLINGLVIVKGATEYQTLINSINEEIKRVRN
ncbi:DUF6261 family protein [Capnocytophaga cynodegmi]|nr:DUF6261 family protein [Capnocytophaga cynodegmi]